MNPTYALMDLVFVMPSNLIMLVGYSKMLTYCRPKLFWTATVMPSLVMVVFRHAVDPVAFACLTLIVFNVLPVAFASDPLPRRLVVSVLLLVAILAGDTLCSFGWLAATGLAVGDYAVALAHLPEFVFVHVAFWALFVLEVWGLWAVLGRDRADRPVGDLRLFVGFLVAQSVLVMMLTVWTLHVFGGGGAAYGAATAAILVCAAADAALFASFSRYRRCRLVDQRAALLEEQLAAYLERYGETVREVETVARVRHDVKNQLLAADETARRGDAERARAQLSAVMRQLADAAGVVDASAGPGAISASAEPGANGVAGVACAPCAADAEGRGPA